MWKSSLFFTSEISFFVIWGNSLFWPLKWSVFMECVLTLFCLFYHLWKNPGAEQIINFNQVITNWMSVWAISLWLENRLLIYLVHWLYCRGWHRGRILCFFLRQVALVPWRNLFEWERLLDFSPQFVWWVQVFISAPQTNWLVTLCGKKSLENASSWLTIIDHAWHKRWNIFIFQLHQTIYKWQEDELVLHTEYFEAKMIWNPFTNTRGHRRKVSAPLRWRPKRERTL